jgi:hypothetical protein
MNCYSFCQTESRKFDYSTIEYEIVNRDTNTITRHNGKINPNEYKKWDSTYITANVILYYLPVVINEDSLFNITRNILISENIQSAILWRDKHYLGFMKFSYMSESMRKQWYSSYIGQLNYLDSKIKFGINEN